MVAMGVLWGGGLAIAVMCWVERRRERRGG